MSQKSVSVVIPTFSKRKELIEAVQSMLQQTYKVAEIIVVDNASTDDTLKYLDKIAAKNKQIKIVRNRHSEPKIY